MIDESNPVETVMSGGLPAAGSRAHEVKEL
jgi:hypothetical protein